MREFQSKIFFKKKKVYSRFSKFSFNKMTHETHFKYKKIQNFGQKKNPNLYFKQIFHIEFELQTKIILSPYNKIILPGRNLEC